MTPSVISSSLAAFAPSASVPRLTSAAKRSRKTAQPNKAESAPRGRSVGDRLPAPMMAGEKGIKNMTPEKVLTWSVAALGHLKQGANGNAADILAMLRDEAEEEIRHATAKQSGNGNRQKAAERVIKNAKASQPFRECFHGAWTENGAQHLCDGFRAYILSEPLPLPTIPEDVQKLDIKRLVDSARGNNGPALNLPDVAELRAYIKTEKARKKAIKDKTAPVYDFGDGLPLVNAQFLLDTLELLPGCTATISSRAPLVTSIYFESVHGCGILCPIKKAVNG